MYGIIKICKEEIVMYKYDYVKIKCQLTGWGFGRAHIMLPKIIKKISKIKLKRDGNILDLFLLNNVDLAIFKN